MFFPLTTEAVDFTPHGSQPGLQFPLASNADCLSCHQSTQRSSDPYNMPVDTWIGSMKANAMRDPLFWAALDVANNDIPGVGDFCLRCHTPEGWSGGRVVKTGQAAKGIVNVNGSQGCSLQGSFTEAASNHNDYSGVTCQFCHRIESHTPLGQPAATQNADIWLDDAACENSYSGEPCRKGPYKYNDGNTPPPHDWVYSSFLESSKYCGSCHDISSPEILDNGQLSIARKFWHNGQETDVAMPIERTYSEWKNSYFADLIYRDPFEALSTSKQPVLQTGQTCQTCHMPETNETDARACVFGVNRPGNLPTHQFAGGNTWIPQVIKAVYGDDLAANDPVGLDRKGALDLTTSYAFNMLQNQSALVTAQVTAQTTQQLTVAVKVTNLTGHKLPTGYPEGRRMWLQLEARDGNNTVFWQSGAYDNSTGVLTEDSQLKVYETLQGIWNEQNNTCETEDGDGDVMFHFVLNNCIAKDNRIPPLGFTGAGNRELAPVGITYPADPQLAAAVVNYDVTDYQINIDQVALPITLTARLNFQVASKEYIEFLQKVADDNNLPSENALCNRNWTEGPANQNRASYMTSLWQTYGRSEPVPMAVDTLVVN
ncbi:hypothetical protein [Marinicella gelatinilytica]|uniref:hypothetical protein n=1 Tax=Marinicella gelatinilytica TaxID=2996017 RepID=UPI002260F0DB|nr:hypothetical protein [Marinicella gelatinilytica]MCX7545219.1 hypothetical protein [Marinicella gelatinilytica]